MSHHKPLVAEETIERIIDAVPARASRAKQRIKPDQLTLHSDRGPSMKSGLLAGLLADLGVTKTHSRPHVSNDNRFSESQFRTLKYRPQFPNRFESFDHAHTLCRDLIQWYNTEHHHTALGLHT